MITTYDKRIIKHFQDWVADSAHDNLGEDNTPENWLDDYLDMIGDIIGGAEIPLKEITQNAIKGIPDERLTL